MCDFYLRLREATTADSLQNLQSHWKSPMLPNNPTVTILFSNIFPNVFPIMHPILFPSFSHHFPSLVFPSAFSPYSPTSRSHVFPRLSTYTISTNFHYSSLLSIFPMDDETCAFCLGGLLEIPPFGTTKDAEDLIKPCSTCSLVAHRKCLLDWFNSIPAAKLIRSQGNLIDNDDRNMYMASPTTSATEDRDDDTDNEPNIINVTFQSPWMSSVGLLVRDPDSHVHAALADSQSVLLLTSCPQCKSKITFCMKRLAFLNFNTLVRASMTDLVQYSGVFLGISGAATGIVTMGYVGLARCGINMLDALMPSSLLFPLLSKRKNRSIAATSLLFPTPDTLDKSANLVDQLRFQHIPLLPVMLYRMRNLLILSCFFNTTARTAFVNWGGEFLVCNYISSLGNHVLVKNIFLNVKVWFGHLVKNPTLARSYRLGPIFSNINWWDPNVMVGALIPFRWVYDLLFRLTINRVHFNLTAKIRPRDIANNLSKDALYRLETLEGNLGSLQFEFRNRSRLANKNIHTSKSLQFVTSKLKLFRLLLRDDLVFKYIKLKLTVFFYKSEACLRRDFSSSLLYNLVIITGFTTVLWPFLASDFGKLIYRLVLLRILALDSVDKDKVIFLANLLGMGGVAIVKDVYNLLMASRKARQLSEMSIVYPRASAPSDPPPMTGFPGSYSEAS